MNLIKTEEWVIECLRLIKGYKISDREALAGAENIWVNILLKTYREHARSSENPLEFGAVLEIQLDCLMKTLAVVKSLMDEIETKEKVEKGENVVPFVRKQK